MGFHSDSESQQFGRELAITHDNADISFGSEIGTSLPGKHHIVLCEKRGVKKNNLFLFETESGSHVSWDSLKLEGPATPCNSRR